MKNKNKSLFCLLMVGMVVCISCNGKGKQEQPSSTPVESSIPTIDKLHQTEDIDTMLASLTIEEKVAQMTGSLESLISKESYTYVEETIQRNVEFPDNLALGVVNDATSLYKIGQYIGKEDSSNGAKVSFVNGCATYSNPMWQGAFACYSDDYETVYTLGESYVKGLVESGIMPCLTDFIGAGYSGVDTHAIKLDDEEIRQQLYIYRHLIDTIAATNPDMPVAIQVSSMEINEKQMVENKELITDMLRGVMKFDGIVIAKSTEVGSASGDTVSEQVANAINAGVDMIRCMDDSTTYQDAIIEAVKDGSVKEDRINEAVKRILVAKKALGVFKEEAKKEEVKSDDTKEMEKLAASLVERSQVLLKNSNEMLPLKKGLSIYVTGPSAATYILQGLEEVAKEHEYTIITDPAQAKDASITMLCLGEDNETAIKEAEQLGHPTIALLVTGSHINLNLYKDNWNAIVMCYQPGSRSDAIANVLCGKNGFVGKLSTPLYGSDTDFSVDTILYGKGYGREY